MKFKVGDRVMLWAPSRPPFPEHPAHMSIGRVIELRPDHADYYVYWYEDCEKGYAGEYMLREAFDG